MACSIATGVVHSLCSLPYRPGRPGINLQPHDRHACDMLAGSWSERVINVGAHVVEYPGGFAYCCAVLGMYRLSLGGCFLAIDKVKRIMGPHAGQLRLALAMI
jgi:hypothetical protein